MNTGKIVKFQEWQCEIHLDHYTDNGRLAIILKDSLYGEQVAVASVNVPDIEDDTLQGIADKHKLEKDRLVFIKDYAENEGVLKALADQLIVHDTGEAVSQGFVIIPLCVLDRSFSLPPI